MRAKEKDEIDEVTAEVAGMCVAGLFLVDRLDAELSKLRWHIDVWPNPRHEIVIA